MKRVERDPEYNALLNQVLDEVQAHSEPRDPGMYDRAGAIFILSPGSVTPYHLDAEYNFLFQLRGAKSISVFDPHDRGVLSEEELEERAAPAQMHRNMVFKDEYQQKAMVFELTTGFALHVPATAPHWVKNGPNVSISFSAGFTTRSNRAPGEDSALQPRAAPSRSAAGGGRPLRRLRRDEVSREPCVGQGCAGSSAPGTLDPMNTAIAAPSVRLTCTVVSDAAELERLRPERAPCCPAARPMNRPWRRNGC